MSATTADMQSRQSGRSRQSLWGKALVKFSHDKMGLIALFVVCIYLLVALGAWFGVLGSNWSQTSSEYYAPMSSQHWFGTNQVGQDIFSRAIFSTRTAFEIGLMVALMSTLLGGAMGALAGFFSGTWNDEVILWIMGVLDSIPFYLFVAAVAFAMQGNPYAMHIAMIATFWTTTARIVRGEVIKLKNLEFVEAARAIGVPGMVTIFRHVLPNTSHILLVQGTIVFVSAIKSEVILSFLGLGVRDSVSWGLMISESTQEVTAGHFANFLSASVLMFLLVMAFNMLSDALQDALDPKKVL